MSRLIYTHYRQSIGQVDWHAWPRAGVPSLRNIQVQKTIVDFGMVLPKSKHGSQFCVIYCPASWSLFIVYSGV